MIRPAPLDFEPWTNIDKIPHITLRDGKVLRIVQNVGRLANFTFTLQLLAPTGWVALRCVQRVMNSNVSQTNESENSAYYELMQYAEYIFAGLGPGPDQANTLAKWQFHPAL